MMRATLQRTNWSATLSVSKWDLRSRLNFNLDFQFLTESFQQCFKARSSYEGPLQYLSALALEDTKYPSEILFSKNVKSGYGIYKFVVRGSKHSSLKMIRGLSNPFEVLKILLFREIHDVQLKTTFTLWQIWLNTMSCKSLPELDLHKGTANLNRSTSDLLSIPPHILFCLSGLSQAFL